MKIAFFGTPDFAIPSLEALLQSPHEIVCIVTQPDKPQGRGMHIAYSAAKKFGNAHQIPVLQPERISREVTILDPYKPDIIVTCAFGQILKQNVLDYCKYGVINVHGSLLPKYRGSSPIQWAVINGEKVTGVTIMHTDAGLDTGDIILRESIEIKDNETAGELFERISHLGAEVLLRALTKLENGTAPRISQNSTGQEPSKFPCLSKETARIDFAVKSAEEAVNFVRGLNPWPVAWFEHDGQVIRVYKASVVFEPRGIVSDLRSGLPGSVFIIKDKLFVNCVKGCIQLETIQLEGGKILPAKDYMNGRKIHI